jgi:hypothetical protein
MGGSHGKWGGRKKGICLRHYEMAVQEGQRMTYAIGACPWRLDKTYNKVMHPPWALNTNVLSSSIRHKPCSSVSPPHPCEPLNLLVPKIAISFGYSAEVWMQAWLGAMGWKVVLFNGKGGIAVVRISSPVPGLLSLAKKLDVYIHLPYGPVDTLACLFAPCALAHYFTILTSLDLLPSTLLKYHIL